MSICTILYVAITYILCGNDIIYGKSDDYMWKRVELNIEMWKRIPNLNH